MSRGPDLDGVVFLYRNLVPVEARKGQSSPSSLLIATVPSTRGFRQTPQPSGTRRRLRFPFQDLPRIIFETDTLTYMGTTLSHEPPLKHSPKRRQCKSLLGLRSFYEVIHKSQILK